LQLPELVFKPITVPAVGLDLCDVSSDFDSERVIFLLSVSELIYHTIFFCFILMNGSLEFFVITCKKMQLFFVCGGIDFVGVKL
jgi:hypothetical protein